MLYCRDQKGGFSLDTSAEVVSQSEFVSQIMRGYEDEPNGVDRDKRVNLRTEELGEAWSGYESERFSGDYSILD